jgi:hypothetical protein
MHGGGERKVYTVLVGKSEGKMALWDIVPCSVVEVD